MPDSLVDYDKLRPFSRVSFLGFIIVVTKRIDLCRCWIPLPEPEEWSRERGKIPKQIPRFIHQSSDQ